MPASVWILLMGALAWTTNLLLFKALTHVLVHYLGPLFASLGGKLPFSVRVYIVLSDRTYEVAAAFAILTPIIVILAGRRSPDRLMRWSRRYALTALVGLAWALLGLSQWYVAENSTFRDLLAPDPTPLPKRTPI